MPASDMWKKLHDRGRSMLLISLVIIGREEFLRPTMTAATW